jgi:hypothetical protein
MTLKGPLMPPGLRPATARLRPRQQEEDLFVLGGWIRFSDALNALHHDRHAVADEAANPTGTTGRKEGGEKGCRRLKQGGASGVNPVRLVTTLETGFHLTLTRHQT